MEGLLQVIILVCLILIIILLGIDKVKIVRKVRGPAPEIKQDNVDIMGEVSVVTTVDSLKEKIKRSNVFEKLIAADTLNVKEQDMGMDTSEGIDSMNDPDEESDEDFDFFPDDDRFSQGVSLDELSKVGNLLQNSNPDEMQEKEAFEIIQKIQGTEMFATMQASIDGASQRIAKLLDKSFSTEKYYGNNLQNRDIDNFDIGNFI